MALNNSKEEAFLEMMSRSAELERHGFDVLKKRPDLGRFFDALVLAGLLDVTRAPRPVETSEGYFQIPYWTALDYLEAAAEKASSAPDPELAQKVLKVMRSILSGYQNDPTLRDNFHTSRALAKIAGTLPVDLICAEDIKALTEAVVGRFDKGMVVHEFGLGLLKKLFAAGGPDDLKKAFLIIEACTQIQWVEEKGYGDKQPQLVVDDHHLKNLLDAYQTKIITLIPEQSSHLFLQRLRELFTSDVRKNSTWLFRPAIEDHSQNFRWKETENILVEALRETVAGWLETRNENAIVFARNMLTDEDEIVRRVGIHLLDSRWEILNKFYLGILNEELFDCGVHHETYTLLKNRFGKFSEEQKQATLDAIRNFPQSETAENPASYLRYEQKLWLSAIVGNGYEPAETWYAELCADQTLFQLTKHPDFLAYTESSWGPGPSAYQSNELVAFANSGSIVQKLNDFKEVNSWDGPNVRALVDMLSSAVKENPNIFVQTLRDFTRAKRPYQHGILSGFKSAWDTTQDAQSWASIWPELVSFFESLVTDNDFWKEPVVEDEYMTPNRDWIFSVIADLIQEGTKRDAKSYDANLLPRTWEIIKVLLTRSKISDAPAKSDAMSHAINTGKGRVIEAMINHSLRVCRVADQAGKGHAAEWEAMRPMYDQELSKCKNANFEFSTLLAAYFANLLYLDREWTEVNLAKIFPEDALANYESAIGGLIFATHGKLIYELLSKHHIVRFALTKNLGSDRARESLLERTGLAYIWGVEPLNSEVFEYLFQNRLFDDLAEISDLYVRIQSPELSADQNLLILKFWKRCVEFNKQQETPSAKLYSSLSPLIAYMNEIEKGDKEDLLLIAPHVHIERNMTEFSAELLRLADSNPVAVGEIFSEVLKYQNPYYDYDATLKKLVGKLAEKNQMSVARAAAEKLRHLPGFRELYDELVKG